MASLVVMGGCKSRVQPTVEEAPPESIVEDEEEPGEQEEPQQSSEEEPEEDEEQPDTEAAERSVADLLDAVRSGNSDSIRQHIDYRNLLQLEDGQSDVNFLELGKYLEYVILEAQVQGNGAVVSVHLVNVDMKRVLPEYKTRAMEMEYNNALEDEPLSPQAMEAEYERMFVETLAANAGVLAEQTVDFHLAKDGDSWKVQSSDALRNGIFGDFWKASQPVG